MKIKITKKAFSLLFVSILISIIVMAFSSWLTIDLFQERYTTATSRQNFLIAKQTLNNIEYSINFGKQIDSFYGIQLYLNSIANDTEKLDKLYVIDRNGDIMYDINGKVESQVALFTEHDKLHIFEDDVNEYMLTPLNNIYYLQIPIRDTESKWIASLVMQFDETFLVDKIEYVRKTTLYLALVLLVILSIILVYVFERIQILDKNNKLIPKKIITTILLIVTSMQIIFFAGNLIMFAKADYETFSVSTQKISQITAKSINTIITKGINYDQLNEVDLWLEKTASKIPEIESILISDNFDDNKGSWKKSIQLVSDSTGKNMYLNLSISKSFYTKSLWNVALNSASSLIVSIFLLLEILTIMITIMTNKEAKNITQEELGAFNPNILRNLCFILFTGTYMSISFVPLIMSKLYLPSLGLSKEIMLGLPISAEAILAGIAMVTTAKIIDKLGWKRTFFAACVIIALGALFSARALDPYVFIAARGISGLGFGLALISMRRYVASAPDEVSMSAAVSGMNSGAYSGVNCGCVIGGMLGDKIGFQNVFYIVITISIITLLFSIISTKNVVTNTNNTLNSVHSKPRLTLLKFIKTKEILSLLILIVLVSSICGMYLDYFFPVFALNLNISAANISRAFMLNGMCIVFLGPILSRYIINKFGSFKGIIMSSTIIIVSLAFFAMTASLLSAYITVILLGLYTSFGIASQNSFYLSQKATDNYGKGNALGLFSFIEKLGQMSGPILLGSLISMGINIGTFILAIITLLFLLAFIILNLKKYTINTSENKNQNSSEHLEFSDL